MKECWIWDGVKVNYLWISAVVGGTLERGYEAHRDVDVV
jgi:hypothetical protein